MEYSREVQEMACVKQGPNHGPAPIPEEGKWVQSREIKDISGFTPWRRLVRAAAGRL